MGYFLLVLLAIFLYKFIFGFVIPVYTATRKIKKQFRQYEQQQQQRSGSGQNTQNPQTPPKKDRNINKEDYIEFEEIAAGHDQ